MAVGDNAENTYSRASGSLMGGTNNLQQSIDALTRAITNWQSSAKGSGNAGNQPWIASRASGNAGFSPMANPFGSAESLRPIQGYGVPMTTFGKVPGPFPISGPYSQVPQSTAAGSFPPPAPPPPPSARPFPRPGGGASMGVIGATAGFALASGLAAHGRSQLADQTVMSSYVAQVAAAAPTNMTFSQINDQARNQAFNSAIGFGPQDQSQGQLALNYVAGGPSFGGQRTPGMTSARAAMNAFGYVNPQLGYTGAAQMAGSLYNPVTSMNMRALGYGTTPRAMGSGNRAMPAPVFQGILRTWYGTGSVAPKNLAASLAQGGKGQLNLEALGFDQQQISSLTPQLEDYNRLFRQGVSPARADQLLTQAAQGRLGAQNVLQGYGVNKSDIQQLKNVQATKTARTNLESGGFNAGLKVSASLLTDFNKALNALLRSTPLGGLIGFGSGITGLGGIPSMIAGGVMSGIGFGIGGAVKGIGSLFSGGSPGSAPGGSGRFGQLQPPRSGGAGGSAPQSRQSSGSTGQLGGGVSRQANAAVNIAEKFIGLPYLFGGDSPSMGGFDCSGLVEYAYGQAGVHLPRTSEAQWSLLQKRAIKPGSAQEGDVVFAAGSSGSPNSPGHEAMMVSRNQIIEAAHTGTNIRIRSYNPGEWSHVGRPTGSLAGAGSGGGANTLTPATGTPGTVGNMGLGMNEGSLLSSSTESGTLMGGGTSMGGTLGSGTSSPTPPGGKGRTTPGGVTKNLSGNKKIMNAAAARFGWGTGGEWSALDTLEMHEAGYNNLAQNPTSTAYGMGQFLDTTWATVGGHKTSDPTLQAAYMMKYIKNRYGDPKRAWGQYYQHPGGVGWYGAGTKHAMRGPAVVGEGGPELMWMHGGEQIASNAQSRRAAGGTTVHLNIAKGAITVHAQGSDAGNSGRQVAKAILAELESEKMYKSIGQGHRD